MGRLLLLLAACVLVTVYADSVALGARIMVYALTVSLLIVTLAGGWILRRINGKQRS